MNKKTFISFILISICLNISAQKIQYSRGFIQTPGAGELQLLANINGYHHLLYINYSNETVLYIFDEQLQLHATRKLKIRDAINVFTVLDCMIPPNCVF